MAGTNRDFDAQAFRDGVRFAMDMAAPVEAVDQATFYFPNVLVYNRPVDADNVPFDPASTVTSQPVTPVRVTCAIEYFDADGLPTNFGTVTPSKITITLLDEEYERVKSCSSVVVGGERYVYQRTEPPLGLFEVGLFTLHFTAEDEG